MIHSKKNIRLNQLSLTGRSPDSQNRLVWENWSTFWYCVYVTGELKIAKPVEVALTEVALTPEEFDILLCKVELINIIHDLLKTGKYCVPSLIGDRSVKYIKVDDLVGHPFFEIAVSHCQLIVITEH